MGALQAMALAVALINIIVMAVLAAPVDPVIAQEQQFDTRLPFNLYNGWIPNDPGPPQQSNFYPHTRYIPPRVHSTNDRNPCSNSRTQTDTSSYADTQAF